MKATKLLTLLGGCVALFAGSVYAADRYANTTGNWEDSTTWQDGNIPTADDTVRISNNAEVTLSSTATVKGFGGGVDSGVLNITGKDTALTISGDWKFWYATTVDVNITGGATVDAKQLSWGTNNDSSNQIFVKDSTLKVGNFEQFNGARKVNGGGSLTLDNSTFKIYNNNGQSMGSSSADYSMVVTLKNGTTFDNNGKDFHLNASGNNSEAILNVFNSTANTFNALDVQYKAGATNKVVIAGTSNVYANGTVTIGSATEGSGASIQLGGFDENGNFVAAGANALKNNYEFKVYDSGTLDYLLGASNFSLTQDKSNTIVNARFLKSVKGKINVDFGNVLGLEEGDYWAALISSTERIDPDSDKKLDGHPFDWDHDINVIESDTVKYLGWAVEGNVLYIQAHVIPEPSTYAMILGALAIALAVYKRRRG